jgi:hypothetical protein
MKLIRFQLRNFPESAHALQGVSRSSAGPHRGLTPLSPKEEGPFPHGVTLPFRAIEEEQ